MSDDRGMRVGGAAYQAPAEPEEPQRTAGKREVWPTLWHRAQLAFPWGSATRLRRRPERRAADERATDESP